MIIGAWLTEMGFYANIVESYIYWIGKMFFEHLTVLSARGWKYVYNTQPLIKTSPHSFWKEKTHPQNSREQGKAGYE